MNLYQVATKNKLKTKDEQLELWLKFNELLKLLAANNLTFTADNVNNLAKNSDRDGEERTSRETRLVINRALKAREDLVRCNLRLVIRIAKRYENDILDLDELIQAGNTGLMRALIKFKPTKDAKFSAYAYFWIKAMILEELGRIDLIKVPPKQRKQIKAFLVVPFSTDEDSPEIEPVAEDNTSSVNRVLEVINEESQQLLCDTFNLENNGSTPLLAAMYRGWDWDTYSQKVDSVVEEVKGLLI